MVTGGVDEIFDIIRAGVPLILTLVTAGGGGGEAASFAGILSVVTGAFELMIDKLAVPQIIFAIMLGVLNCMWDRGIVGKLSELFAFLASWEIKICAFLFVGSLTLGRMGAGSASAVVGKGMKLAVGSVPVVGNLFENSLETVAGCITALKGSAAVALIIIIALASAAKLIKLCVVMLLYKLTAALTEPMGNKKITEMLDCAGEGIKLLIAAYFTVIIMFVTAVSVMLGSFG
jgi:stage III sporulation protein AE